MYFILLLFIDQKIVVFLIPGKQCSMCPVLDSGCQHVVPCFRDTRKLCESCHCVVLIGNRDSQCSSNLPLESSEESRGRAGFVHMSGKKLLYSPLASGGMDLGWTRHC